MQHSTKARLIANAALNTLFADRRVYVRWDGQPAFDLGQVLTFDMGCRIEGYSQFGRGVSIPLAAGAFTYSLSPYMDYVSVGRYASIAPEVRWGRGRHPVPWATMSPFLYAPTPLSAHGPYVGDRGEAYPTEVFDQDPRPISVGHDVWIGEGAMISEGVTIGVGAVIGGRSLVLEDVPPYSVMVGSPVRRLRMRFSEEIVESLLRLQWWRFAPEVLQRAGVTEPERFVDRLAEMIERGEARPFDPPVITGADMISAVSNRSGPAV